MAIKKEFNNKFERILLFLFYLITIFIAAIFLEDFGIHIEEKFHRYNGLYWLNYVSQIFKFDDLFLISKLKIESINDYTLSPIERFNKYGVILDLPIALVEIIFKIDNLKNIYELKHFSSFIIFLMSSFFFFLILKKRFKNFFFCLVGTIIYISSPRIFGDSFLYKDILFLSFLSISLFFFLNTIRNLDQNKYIDLILFSFFAALSFNLRVFALILPITFFY